jgi:HEPN domain-containing protein
MFLWYLCLNDDLTPGPSPTSPRPLPPGEGENMESYFLGEGRKFQCLKLEKKSIFIVMSKEIALKWYSQAEHDLEMADKNIPIKGYDISAFLAQQSVEKMLKAVIIFEGKPLPKTHYIDELARILQLPDDIVDAVLDLSPDYTLARYPDVADHVPFAEYTEELAQEKVKKAKVIFECCKKRLKLPGV